MFKTRRWIQSTKESGSSYSGKKFTSKLSVLSKRFKGSNNVEIKRKAIADAMTLIEQELLADADNATRIGWARVFPDEVAALNQPNGIENLARRMMGIALPAGQTGVTLDN